MQVQLSIRRTLPSRYFESNVTKHVAMLLPTEKLILRKKFSKKTVSCPNRAFSRDDYKALTKYAPPWLCVEKEEIEADKDGKTQVVAQAWSICRPNVTITC